MFIRVILFSLFCGTTLFSKMNPCPDVSEGKVLCFSWPRSGVNLLTCSLMTICKRPIGLYPDRIAKEASNRVQVDWISMEPFVYRTHDPKININLNNPNRVFQKLLFVTRNYKELIFKKFQIRSVSDLLKRDVLGFLDRYITCIKIYDNWDHKKKFLVFYEDMALDFDKVIFSVLDFLSLETPIYINEYLENKFDIQSKIRKSYMNQHKRNYGVSSSNGMDVLYYSNQVDDQIVNYLGDLVKRKYPYIWKKYLKRFD